MVSVRRKSSPSLLAAGKYPYLLPAIIFFASLLVTATVSFEVYKNIHATARHEFEIESGRIRNEVLRRFEAIHSGLKAGKAVYAASDHVRRTEFRSYVKSRGLESESVGMRGFGFVRRVLRSDLPAFVEAERADNAPDFSIHTEGNAPDLYIITNIEPLSNNIRAWGYDIGSDPIRRTAIEKAIETGQLVLSQRTVLVQDEEKGCGFLLVLPIYTKDKLPATREERITAFRGALYAPIVITELMNGVTNQEDNGLDFEIFDGKVSRENLAYDDDRDISSRRLSETTERTGRLFESTLPMVVGGRELMIRTSSKPAFETAIDYSSAITVAVSGGMLGSLLSIIFWLLIMGRRRAIEFARAMTSDLFEAKRRAEASLRENTALLQAMNAHSLVSVTDPNGTIVDANEAFCERSGYTREELIGQNPRLIKSNHHGPEFFKEMWQTISNGKIWRGLACNKCKSGALFWVETTILPILDASNRVEKYISIHNDVTVQIEQRQLLVQATERLELAIHGASDGLWDWTCGTTEVWYSHRFWTLLGFSDPAEFPPSEFKSFEERLHPDDRHQILAAVQRHLDKGEVYDVEYRLRLKSGDYHWFRARGDSKRHEAGRAIRMSGNLQDIHARKGAELKLKESEEFLARAERIAGVGGWQLDLQTMQPDWTPQTCRIHEVPVEHKALVKDAIAFYAEEARPVISKALEECIQNGTPWDLELPFVTRTGRNIWVRTIGERETLNGKPTRLVGTFQDVTERKIARDELSRINTDLNAQTVLAKEMAAKAQKAAEAKSAFLATMSHEIRTPMNGVIGMTDLLCGTELSEEQADYVNAIRMSGESLLTLINDILDFSKIEAGKINIENRSIDLWTIIEGVMDIVAIQAREKMLDLSVVMGERVPMKCVGDATRLRQILLNLLSNAVKFTHTGSVRLKVSVDSENPTGQFIRFEVIDSGIGMTPEVCKRLFSPFMQADDSISRRYGGTGLGLVISRRLSELMGGSIGVESVIGKGSTFWFTCNVGRIKSADSVQLNGLRVLLVEKSAVVREDLRTQLANWGASIEVADSPEQTRITMRRQAETSPFEVVILDPRIGGGDLIQWMRLSSKEDPIQIVSIDINALSDTQKLTRNIGADLYLVKPVKFTALSQFLLQARSKSNPDTPVIDADRLSAIAGCFPGSHAEQLKQVYDTIFKDADPIAAQCLEAIEKGDSHTIERSAHALKGIAGELGAVMLFERAINLMEFGRSNKLENCAKEGAALKAELEKVRSHLKLAMARNSDVKETIKSTLNPASASNPILVVDDIGMNRKVLKTVLTKAGFTVEEAASGKDALSLMQARNYAAIFMDVMMPEMDGLETVRRLRAGDGPNSNGFVIGVSASILEEDRVRCFEAGMNDFVAKPIDGNLLLATLNKLLRNSQRQIPVAHS